VKTTCFPKILQCLSRMDDDIERETINFEKGRTTII
jgi:hypothetical protein